MKVAAIYARVSTEKQEEQKTVVSQLSDLRQAAKDSQIFREYIDDGWSGAILARPALDELRDDASRGYFQVLYVHSPDRLARRYIYQGLIIEELQKKGVEIVFLNHPITDSPEDSLLLQVQGAVAEYEKAKILERTRRGRLHVAKSNQVVGSIPPYGYHYVLKTKERRGYYEVIDDEAIIVRLIFELFVKQRLTLRGIVRELTARKVSPRGGSSRWARSTIARILKNETYIGTTYYNKQFAVELDTKGEKKYYRNSKRGRRYRERSEWIPISVPAIMDKDTFNQAQELLKLNQRFSLRNTKNEYLLRGFVHCGICNTPCYGTPSHGKTYYRCGQRDKVFPARATCRNRTVSSGNLDEVVWNKISDLVQQPGILLRHIESLSDNLTISKQDKQKEITHLEEQISKLLTKKGKFLDTYADELISKEELGDKIGLINGQIEGLQKSKLALERALVESFDKSTVVRNLKHFRTLAAKRLSSFDFQKRRNFLELVVNSVDIRGGTAVIKGGIPVLNGNSNLCSTASMSS